MIQSKLLQVIHTYIPSGLMIWLLLWFVPMFSQVERIIMFASLVMVPLTIFRVMESWQSSHPIFLKLLIYFFPIGMLSLIGSFILKQGILAGLLSIPWALVTFIIAAWGFNQISRGATKALSDVAKMIGFCYISIGGIWLIAHQFGMSLLGFKGEIMLLTVNHFHYAGFVLPILLGFFYEHFPSRLTKTILIVGVVSPILIALGMTFSPLLEVSAVCLFAIILGLYSLYNFSHVVRESTRWTKGLHIISNGFILFTMFLAMLYGIGEWTNTGLISTQTMVLYHGFGNSVLFSFIGLLAWHTTIMDKESAHIPFSRIQGTGKIGSDFFNRIDLINEQSQQMPTGLVDYMEDYKSNYFSPNQLSDTLVDFYENTNDYELKIIPHWRGPFRILAYVYKMISSSVEQMNFPIKAESNEQKVTSRILPIKSEADSRERVRAWVRTYTETNKSIYAALYSSHITNQVRYMNIAFPLPYSQFTSILHLQEEEHSLQLTSWPTNELKGDQGVYLVLNQKAIRFPINETITVWEKKEVKAFELEARHDMWVYGIPFLSLDYQIYRK